MASNSCQQPGATEASDIPSVPQGFRLAGVHCGIKTDPSLEDLSVIICDQPTVAAGVYTQNRIFAAPVAVDRERTPSDSVRAVVVNSGNANACTGEQGMSDAVRMCESVAHLVEAPAEQALVMSTGLIGELLPMEKIVNGIAAAGQQVAASGAAMLAAARGFMTTDTVPKMAGRTLSIEGHSIQLSGIAKGAAMIGPNMATMLGLLMTDAAIEPHDAQAMLAAAAAKTFNCIRVEGHTSTNDTVLLLASGQASTAPLSAKDLIGFRDALEEVCQELALAIVADGEGTTHVVTVDVQGCETPEMARQIAQSVADSPLVKTAIAGADPNWGRIVSAAGYAGVEFDTSGVSLEINGVTLYRKGEPIPFDAAVVSESIAAARDVHLLLTFTEGSAAARMWTTDLTAEYVRLNAEYHT